MKHDAFVIMRSVLERDPPNAKVWFEASLIAEDMR